MPSAASAIRGEWAATETGSSIARFAPSSLAIGEARLHGRALAADDDLPRRVAVGDAEDAVRGGPLHERREFGIIEADDGGHPPFPACPAGLHLLAADPDQAHGIAQGRARPGRHEGRVLAHRVTGRERGVRDVHVKLVPALA